ncbi:multidrug DMT transporter permease [Burkholderia ubonensis]|uniref:MFS transporter n=1 Tax=Burkholderia ubonensis TaxID=101571 RepID=UPI00075E62CC|nr:MFS transporter [Burkholderia ubonensis]KWI85490.1 multidrug DMT transporter permease [Burkholderia ubonensis]KWK03793.1 multidrug DMT transporter permease [Burkholderia ubonensis]KWK05564.1 multidrug DMT transporter permease [Burkholderia ubonensis]KWK35640.1 multidrug DMT transporter permease [Burkholderia ubonensis]KWK38406.1 multidrug DMT transporter permease [Burkholderia ubonensis]
MLIHHVEPSMQDLSVGRRRAPAFAWLVFGLTVGLLLSDYMSRQVLNAVFPLLKHAWGLSDTQLGSLSGIVALLVGVLTFPLSVLADRFGRVRSIVLMAALWSLATLGCALSANYAEMLAARGLVGLGEAAYGSVGVALILSIFPAHLRATLTGAFMAGGAFGSVFGMALGGLVGAHLGWRWSFGVMAALGLVLLVAYRCVVTERRLAAYRPEPCRRDGGAPRGMRGSLRALMTGLFASRSVICAYVGSGLHLFVPGALFAWLPSYLNRDYAMAPDRAAVLAAGFVLLAGIGMVGCGIVTDRLGKADGSRKWLTAIAYCLLTCGSLTIAFRLPPGTLQLALIGVGMLVGAGASGASGAMVANLTPAAIHASAFATLTLANNLLGMAPGPLLTGWVADHVGLGAALQWIPAVPLAAAATFAIGRASYAADLARLERGQRVPARS